MKVLALQIAEELMQLDVLQVVQNNNKKNYIKIKSLKHIFICQSKFVEIKSNIVKLFLSQKMSIHAFICN